MKKYLTVGQVAEQLDVHPNTVRRWLESGKLQAYRMGGCLLVRGRDVDKFIQPKETSGNGEVQEAGAAVLD